MEQTKIDRINELARLKKQRPLTPQEAAEQKALREEYVGSFRRSLEQQLSNTTILYPDGSRKKVTKKGESSRED